MSMRTTARRLARALKTGWLIAGVTLALILAIEGGSWLVLQAAGWTEPPPDSRAQADVYDGASWPDAYFREFRASYLAEWKPYVHWRRRPFEGTYINVDSLGRRRSSYPGRPGPDTSALDVFVFGGSTLWGTGARDSHTIPSLLGRYLNEQGHSVRVTNFGETGYVSTQEAVTLLLQLQRGNVPDIVVFYDGVNDVSSGFMHEQPATPHNDWNRRREFNLTKLYRYDDLVWYVALNTLRASNTATLLRRIIPADMRLHFEENASSSERDSTRAQRAAERVLRTYRSNMRLVQHLGHEMGFASLFYWQPVAFEHKPLTTYEQRKAREVDESLRTFYRRTYALMERELSSKPAFHDISTLFEGVAQPLYIDYCHLAAPGNRRVAQRMAADVTAVIDTLQVAKRLGLPADQKPIVPSKFTSAHP